MSDWPERTADEREAARLERERARQAEQPLDGGYYEDEPYHEDGFPDGYSESDADLGSEVGLESDHYPESDLHPESDGALESDGWEDDDEVPLGTRRVARSERVRRGRADGDTTARPRRRRSRGVGATEPPRPRTVRAAEPRGPRARRTSWLLRGLSLVALAVVAVAIWFAVELFQPFQGSPHGRVTVVVPARAGASQIGDLLASKGVVASGFFFNLRAALGGDRGKLLSGTYHLPLGMSYGAALKALMTPPPAAKTSPVTIVPGKTRRQIDALLRSQGIKGSYLAATRRSPLLNPAQYGAPAGTPSLEGFLFPDTYQVRDPVRASALVTDQLKRFKQEFAKLSLSYAQSQHMTAYDVLTIASIIEMEAATAHDRPLVASVIYNRLRDHIPLGMDSTTRYEFNDYDKALTQSQLASPSLYNTRLHAGLPPTPIGNPGLTAIQAAANPPRTNYLYFVAKVCGNGQSVFESSYNQFLQDSARYTAARAARGGKSPTKC